MAVDVTFLQRLELRPSTGVLEGRPVSLIPAANCSLRLGPATVAQMSCPPDAAGYWKTSGTTASQTSNFVTCLDIWWSSLKTNMDLGDLNVFSHFKMALYSGILTANLKTESVMEIVYQFKSVISPLRSNFFFCLDLSSKN